MVSITLQLHKHEARYQHLNHGIIVRAVSALFIAMMPLSWFAKQLLREERAPPPSNIDEQHFT